MKNVILFSVMFLLGLVVFTVSNSQEVVAQVTQFPSKEVFDAFMSLVTNWKVLGIWGICALIINVAVMILKADFTDKWFLWSTKGHFVKMLILVVLGQIQAVVISIKTGMIWWQAVIAGLFISGGAIAIFNAAKPVFSKVDVAINSAAAEKQKAIDSIAK